jgi:hypothetical protein
MSACRGLADVHEADLIAHERRLLAVKRLIALASEIDPQQPSRSGPTNGRFLWFSSLLAQ